jgi:hypothetical protein
MLPKTVLLVCPVGARWTVALVVIANILTLHAFVRKAEAALVKDKLLTKDTSEITALQQK